MGTAGASASAAIGAATGEASSLQEIIKTGLIMAAAETVLSVMNEFPFSSKPSSGAGSGAGRWAQSGKTAKELEAEGYEEAVPGLGVYVKTDPATGAHLDTQRAILTVNGVRVYQSDVWLAERRLGRKLTNAEIAASGGDGSYFKELLSKERGQAAVNQPIDLFNEPAAQTKSQILGLPGEKAPILAQPPALMQPQQAPVAPPSLSEGQGNRVIPPSMPMPLKTPPAEFAGSRVQYPAPSLPEFRQEMPVTTTTAPQLPPQAVSPPPLSSSRVRQGEERTGVAGTKVEPPKLEQKPAPKVPELRQETEPVRRQDLDAIDEDEWNRGYQDAMSGTRMDIAALGDELSAYAQGVEFARRDRYIKDYLLESHRRINEIMGRNVTMSDIDDAVIAHAEQGKPLPPGIHVIKKGAKAPAVKLANKLGHALMLIQTSNSQGIPIESLTKSKYYMELPWKMEPSSIPNEANIYYGTPYAAILEHHQNFVYIPDSDKWASDVMEPFSHVNPFRRWLNQEKAKQAEEAEIGTEEVRQEVAPKATQPPSEAIPPPFPSSSMAEKGEGRTGVAGTNDPSSQLANLVNTALSSKQAVDKRQLISEATKAFGGSMAEGKYTIKDLYDAIELGVNTYLLGQKDTLQVGPGITTNQAISNVQQVQAMLETLPTQTNRTAEMDEWQQFSTPPNLALCRRMGS
jgi:hypothetical protein